MTKKYTEEDVLQMLKKAAGTEDETPLTMPVMNFGKEKKQAVINVEPASDEEQPLLPMVMKF